jgi:hypothetical protein
VTWCAITPSAEEHAEAVAWLDEGTAAKPLVEFLSANWAARFGLVDVGSVRIIAGCFKGRRLVAPMARACGNVRQLRARPVRVLGQSAEGGVCSTALRAPAHWDWMPRT